LHFHFKQHSLKTYFILLLFIGLRAFGNLAMAWGAKQLPNSLTLNPLGYLAAMLNPYIFVGMALLMVSLLTRMALFSVADLSFVLPMTSVGYVVSVCFGKLFLHEQVSAARWIGAIMIFAATALVGSTPQNTTVVETTHDGETVANVDAA
jgi:uncharacterized membrane protein